MIVLPPIILAGVLGAVLGSFLTVVAHRLPRGQSLAWPGSHCPVCEASIRPYDNVPVLSWLLLRGRCRDCGVRIPARYPLVEWATLLAFAAVVAVRGVDSQLLLEFPFAALLVAVAAIDLEHRIVPNRILAPAAVWALAALLLVAPEALVEHLAAGGLAFLTLLLVVLAYPSGMGMGDVKLAGVMGLYLGVAVAPALLAAFLAGSTVGLVMIARRGAAARKQALPFAPFLALGGLVGLLAGPELIDLYLEHLL